jgi:hypothetical protein
MGKRKLKPRAMGKRKLISDEKYLDKTTIQRNQVYRAIGETEGALLRAALKEDKYYSIKMEKGARLNIRPFKCEAGNGPYEYDGLKKHGLECILVDHKSEDRTTELIRVAFEKWRSKDPSLGPLSKKELVDRALGFFELDRKVLEALLDADEAAKKTAPVADAVADALAKMATQIEAVGAALAQLATQTTAGFDEVRVQQLAATKHIKQLSDLMGEVRVQQLAATKHIKQLSDLMGEAETSASSIASEITDEAPSGIAADQSAAQSPYESTDIANDQSVNVAAVQSPDIAADQTANVATNRWTDQSS